MEVNTAMDLPRSTVLVGDALDRLQEMPDDSVHCCVTSPPYWGLRSYDGDLGMIGLEETMEEHIDNLLAVFGELRRVLRPDATCWLNYGDAWNNSSPPGPRNGERWPKRAGKSMSAAKADAGGIKQKDLLMMPARVAMALQEQGWWLRAEVVWHKTNPMPESVKDRPTAAHEKIFLLTKQPTYFYDYIAVRRPAQPRHGDDTPDKELGPLLADDRHLIAPLDEPAPQANAPRARRDKQRGHGRRHQGFNERWDGLSRDEQIAGGSNLRNVWSVATRPFPDEHFAVFPVELIRPCILAGTSEHGCCAECGAPWTRLVEKSGEGGKQRQRNRREPGREETSGTFPQETVLHTVGWEPTCDHDAERVPATVLDPFAGSGTTGIAANTLGRHAVLIEISPKYAALAADRIRDTLGMLVDVSVLLQETPSVREGMSVSAHTFR